MFSAQVMADNPLDGNPERGAVSSYRELCQECHAKDGNAIDVGDGVTSIGKFPKLAGQNYRYLVKQLQDFRQDKRSNDAMNMMANGLRESDLRDIAAYFASLEAMRGDASEKSGIARNLYERGDARRDLAACVVCHNKTENSGLGVTSEIPVISGQHEKYLLKQLTDWKYGERRNSPGDIMNLIAQKLSDEEIKVLADYLSTQK